MSEEQSFNVSIISTDTLSKVVEYLKHRPYVEAADMIHNLIQESKTFTLDMLQKKPEPEGENSDA